MLLFQSEDGGMPEETADQTDLILHHNIDTVLYQSGQTEPNQKRAVKSEIRNQKPETEVASDDGLEDVSFL